MLILVYSTLLQKQFDRQWRKWFRRSEQESILPTWVMACYQVQCNFCNPRSWSGTSQSIPWSNQGVFVIAKIINVLLIAENKCAQVFKHITVIVKINHGRLQSTLKSIPMVPKEPHHNTPSKCSKGRKGIVWSRNISLLPGQSRKSSGNSGEKIKNNLALLTTPYLLIHCIILAKDQIATNDPGNERVRRMLDALDSLLKE